MRCDWSNTSSVRLNRIVMPCPDATRLKQEKPIINKAFVAIGGDSNIITDYDDLYRLFITMSAFLNMKTSLQAVS